MTRLPIAPSVTYGPHPDQVANLHLPAEKGGPWPCVALLHGGFWRSGWDRTLMTALAQDLARRGFAAWNIEYRRVGSDGGGWPGTLEDVAAALDHLASLEQIDAARVATCGHSAGGHLALWAAARHRLPGAAPGAGPLVRPIGAVSQAGVCDLVRGAEQGLGAGACAAFLGGAPDEQPERYAAASPASLAPLGVPQLLIHGEVDDIVPLAQSEGYAAVAGGEAELVAFAEAGHCDLIDPAHPSWAVVAAWLTRLLSA
ncbi:MAG: alpha/beta hydrolase [Thermoleophilia bacterium]|nr:alpha/beta hydrolase [Thermoleophilia bacterium]